MKLSKLNEIVRSLLFISLVMVLVSSFGQRSFGQCNYTEGQFILSWGGGNEMIYAHYYNGILYAGYQQAGTGFKPRHWLIATGLISTAQANCFATDDPTTGGTTTPPTTGGNTNGWNTYNTNHIINSNSGGVVIGASGTNTPSGYKLYVSDGILTEKLKIAYRSTGNWADFVFSPSYELPDLALVSRYIQNHRHLPGIPSAQEVVNNGLDQNDFNARILQKVEELTLYSIRQDQEIRRLRLRLKMGLTSKKSQKH